MLASLVMAVAIPEAFGDRALLFAGAYVAIQVGRHLFLTFAAAGRGTIERERAGAILIWFVAAGVLWIAGGARRRHRAHAAVARGARDRLRRAARHRTGSPGARTSTATRGTVADVALRRALPAVHHHRARRVDRDHRRDDVRARARRRAARGVRRRVPRQRRALVAVLQLRRAASPSGGWSRPSNRTGLARDALHVPARRAGRGHHRDRGRRRARDRAPDARSCPARRSRRSSPGRRSTCSATCCSAADGRDDQLEAARRRDRLRGGGRGRRVRVRRSCSPRW